MRLESIFFRHVTVISRSLARKLRIENKAKILPLGSLPITEQVKQFDSLDLIYVGTLSKRNIEKTVTGFANFLKTVPQPEKYSYTIIGSGYKGEEDHLRSLAAEYGIESQVRVTGYIPFTELDGYFAKANIGVSFIPITPYFDAQPPTKTFDYLLSGMAVIGTATTENKLYINDSNGVLIDDSAESFKNGLHRIQGRINEFSSETIRKNAQKYHWQHIVHGLEKYLLKITRKGHEQNA
ncbi:MAG: glycosyltransferase [Desulfobacula sp.]|nr:glycosyltransferase [Desulfobacula sp.]